VGCAFPEPSAIVLPRPPRHPTRIVFLGTPQLAVAPLRALHAAGHDVALVVSRGDARRSRRGHAEPSPVKAAALELGLPVTDRLDDALDVSADLGVVAAYGRIIPVGVLERLPMVNLHYSLLPRWRGAAPVERAILAGDDETGVCLMQVEEGLDTGGVYARVVLPIGPHETADALRDRLSTAGTRLLLDALRDGIGVPAPQVGEPSYAEKVHTSELELDWTRPADELERVVRVGGAWTTIGGRRLKVWRAEVRPDGGGLASGVLDGTVVGTGSGALELCEVQPDGKPRVRADDWRRGLRAGPDRRLGS
jgi:methionyl-tRNA formyltransferase